MTIPWLICNIVSGAEIMVALDMVIRKPVMYSYLPSSLSHVTV